MSRKREQNPKDQMIEALKDGIEALEHEAGRLAWEAESYLEAAATLGGSDVDKEALEVGIEALRERADFLEWDAERHRDAIKVFQTKIDVLKGKAPPAGVGLKIVKSPAAAAAHAADPDSSDWATPCGEAAEKLMNANTVRSPPTVSG